MWIEIEILLKDDIVDWKDLGFSDSYDSARRMVRITDIAFLQEALHDIQILAFKDRTSVYIKGDYAQLRDKMLHIQFDMDNDL